MTASSDKKFEIEKPGEAPRQPAFTTRKKSPSQNSDPSPSHTLSRSSPPPQSGAWVFIPFLLFIAGASLVATTQDKIGYAWDEAYYYEPSQKAAEWLIDACRGQNVFSREAIDAAWDEHHEHPSFQKILSGLSLHYFEKTMGPIRAMRFPNAGLFGLTLVLLYLLGRRAWNAPAGLIAALSYLALPRIFGHAHFASMETPLNFMTLLTIYAFVRGLDSRFWSLLTGIFLGVLLATKINGFFLIPPLVLWGYLYARSKCVHNLVSMAILGPLAFVGMWPWLWNDTIHRVLEYLQYYATHQQTAVWFMNQKWGYGNPPAPWFYPSVIIGVTVPASVLIFAALGLLGSLVGIFKNPLWALYLLVGLTHWGVASLPETPKYDGERLFVPVFLTVALLAGAGANMIFHLARRADEKRRKLNLPGKHLRFLGWCFALALLLDGGIAEYRYYPYFLSYFNPFVGGLPGAEAKGFETTYWGEAVNDDVLQTINKEIPPGGNLKVLALHEKCFQHLQRWGKLRSDIRLEGEPPFFARLLLWRKGFFGNEERALTQAPIFRPLGEWKLMDVPLVTLYRTGPEFEQYRAAPLPTIHQLALGRDQKTTATLTMSTEPKTTATQPMRP